jgi:hypothetical protein
MGVWRYSSTIPLNPGEKSPTVPFGKDAGLVLGLLWMLWRREKKLLHLAGVEPWLSYSDSYCSLNYRGVCESFSKRRVQCLILTPMSQHINTWRLKMCVYIEALNSNGGGMTWHITWSWLTLVLIRGETWAADVSHLGQTGLPFVCMLLLATDLLYRVIHS